MANSKAKSVVGMDDNKQPQKQVINLLTMTLVLLVAISLGFLGCKQGGYFQLGHKSTIRPELELGTPDRLLNYSQFRLLYPLIKSPSLLEDLHRKLSFNAELIWICQANLATLVGLKMYYLQQSPFAFSNQLIDGGDKPSAIFGTNHLNVGDYVQMANGMDIIDFMTGTVKKDGAKLHRNLPIARPLIRAIVNEKHYEVPNKPLDEQTNTDKITHIDVDHRYCTGPVPNQGQCGSCYAFAFNAYIEWQYCNQSKDKKPVKFSDQYIIDCGPDFSSRLRGCNSGVLNDVRNFHHHNGFFFDKDYTYEARSNWCRHKTYNTRRKRLWPNHKLFIAHVVHEMRDELIDREEWEKILKIKPILVGVDLPSDYSFYSKGIHHGKNCSNGDKGHAMILIGMGRENGHPYWLLKNSMGPKWGENGYMRLSRLAPMRKCFSQGYVIEHSFVDNEESEFQVEVEDDIGQDDVAWFEDPAQDEDEFEQLGEQSVFSVKPDDFANDYDEFGNKRFKLIGNDDKDEKSSQVNDDANRKRELEA